MSTSSQRADHVIYDESMANNPPLNVPIVGMPYDVYADFRAETCLRSTQIKAAAKSVAHFRLHQTTTSKASEAMMVGILAHEALFEPDQFILSTKPKLTTLVDKKSAATAEAIRDSILSHPVASQLIRKDENTFYEASIFWNDREHNLPCKARIDCLSTHRTDLNECTVRIIDLKTCRDCSPDAFARDAHKLHYALQMQHYTEAVIACGLEGFDGIQFLIIAAEKSPPYGLRIYNMGDWADFGRTARKEAINNIWEAYNSENSPCYKEEVAVLELPSWLRIPKL